MQSSTAYVPGVNEKHFQTVLHQAAHQYFQEWVELGVFDEIRRLALQEYDDLIGLNWRWQSADCAMTKSPLGHEETGKIQLTEAREVRNDL
jgi:hypothetical protein